MAKRDFAVLRIPLPIHARLRLESVRTGRTMQQIYVAALDKVLPKNISVVIGKDVPEKTSQQSAKS
jgi:hypothetical protein